MKRLAGRFVAKSVATTVDYDLVAALIAAVSIGAVTMLAASLNASLATACGAIS